MSDPLPYLGLSSLIRVPESYPRHVRTAARTCPTSQPYPGLSQPYSATYPGSKKLSRTCLDRYGRPLSLIPG
jgi:hypothetical protein